MASPYPYPCVHHIELGVTDGPRVVSTLRDNFTFDIVATRDSNVARQWLMRKQDTRYLVTCLKSTDKSLILNDDYVIDWMDVPSKYLRPGTEHRPRKDSVFNLCLQVGDLDQTLNRLEACHVLPIFPGVKTVTDSFGSVRICTVKSCVGDVYHTLIENHKGVGDKLPQYCGVFLPGFLPVKDGDLDPVKDEYWDSLSSDMQNNCTISPQCKKNVCDTNNVEVNSTITKNGPCPVWTVFDHVAIAVEMGTAGQVIDWYEKCFGMKRFLINSEEDQDEGLVLSSEIASLRLRAMEYWKCAETGLESPTGDVDGKTRDIGNRLSMVVVEGLPPKPYYKGMNQIESFLSQHGGAGIQHIALTTRDIKATVAGLKGYGVKFANPPPPTYYTQDGRLDEILRTGEDPGLLQQHGILIDMEADRREETHNTTKNRSFERYLMQIFTNPFLPKDPCFMEIIQREGALGFGSGNIAALYRSIQAGIIDKAKGLS